MTKTKSTKRALLLSALSLLMCVSMLVGSTFAWFTDSATSANNKIVAGKLDVELYMWNGTTYENISETSKPIFGEGSIAQNNNAVTLWEPGKTQVAYLKLVNEGSLALNYTVGLNVQNVSKDLYKAMQYAITPDAQPSSVTTWNGGESVVLGTQTVTAAAVEMAPGAEHYFALSIHMDELAGNEYQGGEVNFDLTVLANQAPVESDSFNNQYDANANVFNVTNQAEAQAALNAAEDGAIINLAAGNYGTLVFRQNASSSIVDITAKGGDAAGNEKYRKIKNLTINGADGTIVDGFTFPTEEEGVYSYIDIENWTVNNVTFSAAQTPFDFEGTTQLGIDGLTIVNCKMEDGTWAGSTVRLVYQGLIGYTDLNDKSKNEYVMTTGVKNLTITGCEVIGAYQVIETRQMENLTITNNTFKYIESRDIMLAADPTAKANGVTYTGTITITGNKSSYGTERFIRGAGIGDATLVIKDNKVAVYANTNPTDYIKVEGATGAREVSGNIADNGLTVNIP